MYRYIDVFLDIDIEIYRNTIIDTDIVTDIDMNI